MSLPVFTDKPSARLWVWDRLAHEGVAAPPLPPHGRIPNFTGAAEAARRLFDLPPWRDARRIKVNPDRAQADVRAEALRRAISVYVATPKLAGGFLKLDPARIPPDRIAAAARRSGWAEWAEPVALDDLPQMDAIVAGSVAVTADGRRAGKGAGYSDLEAAILQELGHAAAPVATTVHDAQIVGGFPVEPIDQRLAAIATPSRAILVDAIAPAAAGLDWRRLTAAQVAAMPLLAELRRRAASSSRRPHPGRGGGSPRR